MKPSDTQLQNAWQWIFDNWYCNQWRRIPAPTRQVLCLPDSLGLYSGMLCTELAAKGAQSFIQRLNQPRKTT